MVVWIVLSGWGGTGHRKINENATLSFPQSMEQFNIWTPILGNHASDADNRKSSDPDEGRKHYLDLDNYSEFNNTGEMSQSLDSLIINYGQSFVYTQGLLPWATKEAYDSLQSCFERSDWDKAVLFAADLGHYVADGHMPLHITRNYNGQYSGNSGIHYRYESTMINENIGQINYEGDTGELITDVNQFIFNYLYSNYKLVDSVIDADDYAKTLSSDYSSAEYKNDLWDKTKGFTADLFKNASLSIASLIYTAWINSGSPSMQLNSTFEKSEFDVALEQNMPNPFQSKTIIRFTLKTDNHVQLLIKDVMGNNVAILVDSYMTSGRHTVEWSPINQPGGIYFLILNTGELETVKTMVLSD